MGLICPCRRRFAVQPVAGRRACSHRFHALLFPNFVPTTANTPSAQAYRAQIAAAGAVARGGVPSRPAAHAAPDRCIAERQRPRGTAARLIVAGNRTGSPVVRCFRWCWPRCPPERMIDRRRAARQVSCHTNNRVGVWLGAPASVGKGPRGPIRTSSCWTQLPRYL
jgi:hypothetical protein